MPIITGATTPSFGALEVFWKDHRNQNGKWKIANDLVRYTINDVTPGSPLLEVWSPTAVAWVSVGNYQLQVTNTGPVLPVQQVQFGVISPEETIWTERRYDSAGTALVVVTNRIRRGSRLIESQIVAASGAGLTGTQSIGIAGLTGTLSVFTTADTTGVVCVGPPGSVIPGFCFLTAAPNAPSIGGSNLFGSGATVPAGTITRLSVLVGFQDAQWTTLGANSTLYTARWAQYNRTRIRQRLLVGQIT